MVNYYGIGSLLTSYLKSYDQGDIAGYCFHTNPEILATNIKEMCSNC